MSGQLHAPSALPSRKKSRYPVDKMLGGHHRSSGHYGKRKILALMGIEPRPLVDIPSELSGLILKYLIFQNSVPFSQKVH
jgi:hypothetical protein